MRIGINLLGEMSQKTGTGRYAFELIASLSKIDNDNKYIVFVTKKNKNGFTINSPRLQYVTIRIPFENLLTRRFYEQTFFLLDILKIKLDILHSTNNVAPVLMGKKNSVVIHDMARWKTKGTGNPFTNFFLKVVCLFSARFSKVIITDSQSSKNDICSITRVDPQKIDVVRLGSVPVSLFGKDKVITKSYTKRSYIFMHGSVESRKNHLNLIRGFISSKLDMDLLIAGKMGYGSKEVIEYIRKNDLNDRVRLLGYISDLELLSFIANSNVFAFPSLFEGAGLPPLEAMALGIPCLLSNIDVIREYCGEAGYYVNPNDIEDISRGLKELNGNLALRQSLVEKGKERVKLFTWDKCAKETLLCWEKMII